MKILLVNDDGVSAPGLHALAHALCADHELYIVAPSYERSGCGHSLTFHEPLNFKPVASDDGRLIYSLDGTPADCVKFGIDVILGFKPDLVISGINNTCNIGTDIVYSGTVNAALEACLHKVKAIAVSYENKDNDYAYVAKFVARNVSLLADMLPGDCNTIFNINFPCPQSELKGVRIARTGDRFYLDEYQYVPDKGYFITGHPVPAEGNDPETDVVLCEQGWATVSPVRVYLNDDALWSRLKEVRF